MSGHSKWSQIKHKKALTDKRKGQIFSRLSRLITLAARKGTDPKFNTALAQIIERARSENMPNDSIERAIKKVSDKGQDQLEELSIEAIGPMNVVIKIGAVSDNRNRTISEIKKILGDNDFKMVQPGSMTWIFNQPPINIDDPDLHKKIDKLFDALDEQDDIEDVTSNIQ